MGFSKQDLTFVSPLMNAAGTLGFTPEARAAVDWGLFGAFLTNPISLRPRRPAANPALIDFPGGCLLHSGLPNPGLPAVLKKFARRWAEAALPVIPHLMADRPEETARMAQMLEGLENVAALELGFAPQLSGDLILMTVESALGELPIIVNLPFDQVLTLGPRLVQAGAAALSLSAPRGALPGPGNLPVTGRLLGPGLFPQAYEIVRSATRLGLPIIGGVGIYSRAEAEAMLAAGALAVQVDAVVWRGGFN
jgi:dihydroorotate dehydrogenase